MWHQCIRGAETPAFRPGKEASLLSCRWSHRLWRSHRRAGAAGRRSSGVGATHLPAVPAHRRDLQRNGPLHAQLWGRTGAHARRVEPTAPGAPPGGWSASGLLPAPAFRRGVADCIPQADQHMSVSMPTSAVRQAAPLRDKEAGDKEEWLPTHSPSHLHFIAYSGACGKSWVVLYNRGPRREIYGDRRSNMHVLLSTYGSHRVRTNAESMTGG
jgi:hypothetical protein